MQKFIIYLVLVVIAVLAIDAISFSLRQTRMIQVQEKRLDTLHEMNTDALVAFVDNEPDDDDECKAATGCTSNTIDADCSILACQAEACDGDYSSGECKDKKDLHEIACFGAKEGCGDTLPDNAFPPPLCADWWAYGCRIALVFDTLSLN